MKVILVLLFESSLKCITIRKNIKIFKKLNQIIKRINKELKKKVKLLKQHFNKKIFFFLVLTLSLLAAPSVVCC